MLILFIDALSLLARGFFVFHLSQKMLVVCRILFHRVGFARVLRLLYIAVEKTEETDESLELLMFCVKML